EYGRLAQRDVRPRSILTAADFDLGRKQAPNRGSAGDMKPDFQHHAHQNADEKIGGEGDQQRRQEQDELIDADSLDVQNLAEGSQAGSGEDQHGGQRRERNLAEETW